MANVCTSYTIEEMQKPESRRLFNPTYQLCGHFQHPNNIIYLLVFSLYLRPSSVAIYALATGLPALQSRQLTEFKKSFFAIRKSLHHAEF